MRIGGEKIERLEKDVAALREMVRNGRIESEEIMRRTASIDQGLKLAFDKLQASYQRQMLDGEKHLRRAQVELNELFIANVSRDIVAKLECISTTLSYQGHFLERRLKAIESRIVKATKEKAGIGRPAEKRVSARVSPSRDAPKNRAAAPEAKKGKPKVTTKRTKRG